MRKFITTFASMKVTVFFLICFLLLTFWGVIGIAFAEYSGASVEYATERFFNSFIIWALGYVPIPGFKSLAIFASVHLIFSLFYRIPRGAKNAGLYGIHIALLILLLGSVIGSSLKQEYNGYATEPSLEKINFFESNDSLGLKPITKIKFESYGADIRGKWPYSIQYRGYIEMLPHKKVDMYKVYYDPLSFIPYVFLGLTLISLFFIYFVKIKKNFLKINAKKIFLFVLFLPFVSNADANIAASPILYENEVRPFDSFARRFVDDLSGKVSYKCKQDEIAGCPQKLSAIEVVNEIIEHPENANRFRLFKVLRSDVQHALNLPLNERYVSYQELFTAKDLIELYVDRDDSHPATTEMKRLYANLNLYESLMNANAFQKINPQEIESSQKLLLLKLEVIYHKINLCLWAFVFALIGFVLALVNLIFKNRKLDCAANISGITAAVLLCLLFVLRFVISSRVPLANLYEIILCVALLLESFQAAAFLLCKKRTFTLMIPIAFMVSVMLFFAKFILETGDTFQKIPTVLNSSVFLTLHVFTIALGFAGMILSGVVSHVALLRTRLKIDIKDPIMRLLYATLVFGSSFTIIGTLLGGVWADYAWGRFWGFDPKECGALFICIWSILSLHLIAGKNLSVRGIAFFNSFNIIVTFLCWFGVNLLGIGLHSYGFQNGTFAWLFGFICADLILIFSLSYYLAKYE